MEIVICTVVAYILDGLFGDPSFIQHPIIYIGKLISSLEYVIRESLPKSPRGELIGGTILWIMTVSISFLIPFTILGTLWHYSKIACLILNTFWSFQILASRTLEVEALKVKAAVDSGNIETARKALSMIVGRDTSQLDKEAITKAVIETVSENTTDGVTSPLIYLLIGGAPLGFLYKGVNTLDSMVGYKSEKHIYFGKTSAILDDVFNYIPARITGIFMCMVSFIAGLDYKNAWKMMMRDHKKHASPNGGWTEAATAGALRISLGGDAVYFGKLHKKASLGDSIEPITSSKINDTCKLMWYTGIAVLLTTIIIKLLGDYFVW